MNSDTPFYSSSEDADLRARFEEARRNGLQTDSLLETSSDNWSGDLIQPIENQSSTSPANQMTGSISPSNQKQAVILEELKIEEEINSEKESWRTEHNSPEKGT